MANKSTTTKRKPVVIPSSPKVGFSRKPSKYGKGGKTKTGC